MDHSRQQDEIRLGEAISLAIESVASDGGPFGAVVYRGDERVAAARNRVTPHCDPTAHAEVMALREAGHALGRPHLDGCVLYASCHPCPMCLAAALWARVDRVVYAAGHAEAGRAGFDDSRFATQLYGQPDPVALPDGFQQHVVVANATAPFDAWLAKADRLDY